jgi:hypothetical protein
MGRLGTYELLELFCLSVCMYVITQLWMNYFSIKFDIVFVTCVRQFWILSSLENVEHFLVWRKYVLYF